MHATPRKGSQRNKRNIVRLRARWNGMRRAKINCEYSGNIKSQLLLRVQISTFAIDGSLKQTKIKKEQIDDRVTRERTNVAFINVYRTIVENYSDVLTTDIVVAHFALRNRESASFQDVKMRL